jgi:hypothetical protein
MLREILNIPRLFLDRGCLQIKPSLIFRGFPDFSAESMKAILRVASQNENRNGISSVKPKQHCAFELANRRRVFGDGQDTRTGLRFRFMAWSATHGVVLGRSSLLRHMPHVVLDSLNRDIGLPCAASITASYGV